ncbi:MAG: hypothetical protein R3E10_02960 [Gemmatimonadota bacterium]
MTRRHPRREAGTPAPTPDDKRWPRWLPAVVYALVTLVLFRKFVFSSDMLLGTDTLSLGYAARKFFAEALRSGTFPLWNPLILGGTPFLDSLAGGDSLYPTSLLLLVMEPYRALGWKLVLHVFLAGVFMYGWVRALGGGPAGSFVAGLAYLMAPFMVSLVYPGHDGKIFVTALTPLAFWTTERMLAGGGARWMAAQAATVGLVLLTTHFQMAYFLFGALGLYAVARTVVRLRSEASERSRAALRFGGFLGAALLGAGIAAIQLLPAVRYVNDFSRRTATTSEVASEETRLNYSSSYSLHPEEVMGFLAPEFVGNGIGDGAPWAAGTYWGRNDIKLGHLYFGVVVLLLAGIGLLGRRRDARAWTLAGLGVLAVLYGLGRHTPVWRLFYEVVPGVSLFRAPDMVAFLTGFAAVTLGGLGVDALLDRSNMRWTGALRWAWGLTAVLGLLTVLAAAGILESLWLSVVYPQAGERARAALAVLHPHLVRGFGISFFLSAGTAGAVHFWRSGSLPVAGLVGGLAVLLGLDAFRADDPFIQTFDVRRWEAPDANMRYLEALPDAEPSRLLSLMTQDAQDVKPALYGVELVAGHHPNDLARYRELIGMQGSGPPENLLANPRLTALLNVGYLLWPEAAYGQPPAQGMSPVAAQQLGDGRIYTGLYPWNGLPRARLVGDVVVRGDAEAVPYMLSPEFDPATQVVLAEAPEPALPPGPVSGDVRWVERGLNRMRLAVRSDREALLVVADNWYPAWRARVDGAETPVLRAYHTLRAVRVPAGQSEVEMYYSAATLRAPLFLTTLSLLGVLVLLAVPLLAGRKPTSTRD